MHRLRAAVFLVLTTVAPATAQDSPSQIPTIVTTGEAIVRRAPDQAFIGAAIETRARNPRDAQRQNADMMTTVQQRLADAGIPKDAIRTTGYSVQQEFDYSNGRRIPREYVAHNAIEIRVDAVDRTGDILDVVVQAGATAAGGVRFDIRDRAGAEREALRLAVADARGRADALAAGAGRTVDRILRIDDSRPQSVVPMARQEMMSKTADAATPIDPATIEIRAHIVLTVAIK